MPRLPLKLRRSPCYRLLAELTQFDRTLRQASSTVCNVKATGLLPTQLPRLGPDCTTKSCRSVLLSGSASMLALHTSVDVGLQSNQTAFIHFRAAYVLADFSDMSRSTARSKDHWTPLAFAPFSNRSVSIGAIAEDQIE